VSGCTFSKIGAAGDLMNQGKGETPDAVCELLYDLARDIPEAQVIVAVDKERGEATAFLVRGSKEGKQSRVFSFTLQKESPEPAINLDKDNGQNILVLRHELDEDAARRWKDEIGLLWVNAFNEYQDLKRILRCWQCHLSPDARVVVNSCDQPGMTRVLKEYLGDMGDLKYKRNVGSAMVLTVDRCTHHWMIDSDNLGVCKHCGRKRNFKKMINEAKEAEAGRRKGHVSKTKAVKHTSSGLKARNSKTRYRS